MFRKVITALVAAVFLSGAISSAHALTLSSPSIQPMPLQTVKMNGLGNISFMLFDNERKKQKFHKNNSKNISIEVLLSKLEVAYVSDITGAMIDFFDVVFDDSQAKLTLIQNATIPANAQLEINIPVQVTENSNVGNVYEAGFEAAIIAPRRQVGSVVERYTFTYNEDISVAKITGAEISPSPLATVEEGGEGLASFELDINGDKAIRAQVFGMPNIEIRVSHSDWLELKHLDVSQLSGPLLDYFEPVYSDEDLYLRQVDEIPAGANLSLHWPVTVLRNSTEAQSLNMYVVNISSLDVLNVIAFGSDSASTYTKSSIDEVAFIKDAHAKWKKTLKEQSQAKRLLTNPFRNR